MSEDVIENDAPSRTLDFKELLDVFVENDQKTWEFDRNASLGASEAFGCIRQAFYKKSQADVDPDYVESWGALRRGDLIENEFLVPGLRAGLKHLFPEARLLGAGDKQKTLVKGRLSATADGMLVGIPRDCLAHKGIPDLGQDEGGPEGTAALVTEFKSIDPRVNLKEEKAIHNGQTQVQLGLLRDMTKHTPNYAVVIYVNCSFFDDTSFYTVEFDPEAFKAAEDRAKSIFRPGAKATDFMAEGRIDGSCDLCRFKRVCMKDTLGSIPPDNKVQDVPDDVLEAVHKAMRDERDAQAEFKKAEKAKKAAAEHLKEILRSNDVRRAKGDGWSVSISAVKGRRTLNLEAVEEAGIDLEPYYVDGLGHEKLNIRES